MRPSLEEAIELSKIIHQRLSSSELRTCKSLLNDLDSNRRGRIQVHTSLGRLFKKDEFLHQRFTQLFPYTDDQEDTDIEEGETREEDHHPRDDHPKIDHQAVAIADEEIRVTNLSTVSETALNQKILTGQDSEEGEIREDQHLRDDPKIDHQAVANHEIRVTNVTPNYRLLMMPEEEEKSRVSERVLNNECLLEKVDTYGVKILTSREEAMANCEDKMFHADLVIDSLRSAVEGVEKVINGEMRMEHLGVSFHRSVKELLDCRPDTINETALPGILIQLNEKLNEFIRIRGRMKPGWKKVFKENSANKRDSTALRRRRK